MLASARRGRARWRLKMKYALQKEAPQKKRGPGCAEAPAHDMPSELPRTGYAGNSVYGADGRSYRRGVTSHGHGAIGPGLCGFPRRTLLGSSVSSAKSNYTALPCLTYC